MESSAAMKAKGKRFSADLPRERRALARRELKTSGQAGAWRSQVYQTKGISSSGMAMGADGTAPGGAGATCELAGSKS